MSVILEEIYSSSNGDRWHLMEDASLERLFVRHEANLAAGGRVTDMGIADFLQAHGSGPEYAALENILHRRGVISPTANKIRRIISDHLRLAESDIVPDAALIDDLGADSFDVIEIVMLLEEAFDVEIRQRAAEKVRLVKDAVDCVTAQTTSR